MPAAVADKRRAVDEVRRLVQLVGGQTKAVLEEAVEPPPALDLTGPRGGEPEVGPTIFTADTCSQHVSAYQRS